VGGAAALLFGGVTVVVAETGQVYPDLAIGAALTWGLVAWLREKRGLAAILFSVAALMKVPAPLTVPAALLPLVMADPAKRRDLRAYAALAAPLIADVVWLAYHAAITGWVLSRPGRTLAAPQGGVSHLVALGRVLEMFLLDRWRWVVLVAAIAALAWTRSRSKEPIPWGRIAPLLAPIVLGLLLFAAVGEFAYRYAIYLLPLYFVAALTLVRAALPRGVWLVAGALGLFGLFATTWHPKPPLTTSYVFRPDEDLQYLDMIAIGGKEGRWLASKHPDAEIYGSDPESYELAEPWQGYVDAPIAFAPCRDFERHPEKTQFFALHPYASDQPACRRAAESVGARPVKRFESNGKWLELFLVPKP
jgi:hypothetical protein